MQNRSKRRLSSLSVGHRAAGRGRIGIALVLLLLAVSQCAPAVEPGAATAVRSSPSAPVPDPSVSPPLTSPLVSPLAAPPLDSPPPGRTPVTAPEVLSPVATPLIVRGEPVAWAVVDLAARLGVAETAVELLSAERQEFALGDLNCPDEKGMEQPPQPAEVMGQVLVLRAGGQEYLYHLAGGRARFCGPR